MAMTVTPFLMFQGGAEEAAELYASLFPEGRFEVKTHAQDGDAQLLEVEIGGQRATFLESPPVHDFDLTPSFSFWVDCDEPAEVETLYAAFAEGGKVLMALDSYPFSPRYAWVVDRFGLSWQMAVKAEG